MWVCSYITQEESSLSSGKLHSPRKSNEAEINNFHAIHLNKRIVGIVHDALGQISSGRHKSDSPQAIEILREVFHKYHQILVTNWRFLDHINYASMLSKLAQMVGVAAHQGASCCLGNGFAGSDEEKKLSVLKEYMTTQMLFLYFNDDRLMHRFFHNVVKC